jgi:hypothetical protein
MHTIDPQAQRTMNSIERITLAYPEQVGALYAQFFKQRPSKIHAIHIGYGIKRNPAFAQALVSFLEKEHEAAQAQQAATEHADYQGVPLFTEAEVAGTFATAPTTEIADFDGTEDYANETGKTDTPPVKKDWKYWFDVITKGATGVNATYVNPPKPKEEIAPTLWLGVSPFVWLGGGFITIALLVLLFKPSKKD